MAMALLIGGAAGPRPVLGTDAADRLGDLGVSRATVLLGDRTVGVLLEGWAFDPALVDEAVGILFPGGSDGIRTLHEQVVVSVPAHGRSATWNVPTDESVV